MSLNSSRIRIKNAHIYFWITEIVCNFVLSVMRLFLNIKFKYRIILWTWLILHLISFWWFPSYQTKAFVVLHVFILLFLIIASSLLHYHCNIICFRNIVSKLHLSHSSLICKSYIRCPLDPGLQPVGHLRNAGCRGSSPFGILIRGNLLLYLFSALSIQILQN